MLSVQDIVVHFDKPVLKGITLNIRSNSVSGILGKNGAGKTTLFNTIYGLIKPSNGSVTYDQNSALQKIYHYWKQSLISILI